ncbi:MAG: hypothetical protein H6744_03590 [Deltaproteobacteria bacterium]|nr:hypothetical protein [Deltaproteobacteria bacterium]MCB9785760.1 hypothetical protein [Deltaproteobacteria bacterium]
MRGAGADGSGRGGGDEAAPGGPGEVLPAGLASELLMAIGHKPVVRELHDLEDVDAARARWEALGCVTVVGEPVREDVETQAMVTEVDSVHTVRPLATHPLVERAVALGGPVARQVLLNPQSPVHRWLCERLGAEQAPVEVARPPAGPERARQVVYASRELALAERARALDRMASDGTGAGDATTLGALLGYPACCARAFAALERRWPNRRPIEAAMGRTRIFLPRLNNLALHRFAWLAWFPCRYDCEASAAIADLAAAHLARTWPDLVRAIDAELGQPRVYLNDAAQAALVDARWDGPTRLRFAGVAPLGDDAAAALAPLQAADHVVLDAAGASFREGRRRIELSGPPALVLPFGLGPPPARR